MTKTIRPHSGYSIIECKNGDLQVCFKTGRVAFRQHKQLRKNAIHYNPRATAPRWTDFVRQAFAVNADPAVMVDYFHRFLGWTMYPTSAVKTNWILWGHEQSGKYQLLNIARPLIGPEKWDELTFTNRRPRLTDDNPEQYQRRAIPFDMTFMESELCAVDLERIAKEEMSGILNLSIQGLQRVIVDGFQEPGECGEALEKWGKRGGHVRRFLDDCCFRQLGLGHEEFGHHLHQRYSGWKEPYGEFLGKTKFYFAVENEGVKKEQYGRNRVIFKDIIIKAKSGTAKGGAQMSA